MNLAVTATTSSTVSLSWSASTDNVSVSSYDVYMNGVFKANVFGTSATVSGLNPSTAYTFHIVAKDNSGNVSGNSAAVVATTQPASTGEGTSCGTEDFENIPAVSSSYADKTWSNKGIVWTATNARTDAQIYIDGTSRAICLRKGSLKSSLISGGIGTLTVKTFLPFSDSNGNYTLKINGVVKGQIPYSKNAATITIENINVSGDFTIELIDETTSNRVSFDNLTWTCYAPMSANDTALINQKLTVYPNPVRNGEFFINGIDKKETLKIYSVTGQLLKSFINVGNNEKVNVQSLAKGVYFITTKSQSAKIIVE